MNHETETDEELMFAYQQGDEGAFRTLYGRYSARIYGYLRLELKKRNLVDDAFQTVFLKLHQFRSRYSPTLPFAPWLFTICRNASLDILRGQARKREESNESALEQLPALSEAPAAAMPDLGSLTPDRLRALHLRFGEDLSFEEIADRLGKSPGNVRQLVSRALRQLQKIAGHREAKS